MKNLIFILSIFLLVGCSSDDDLCLQTWKYSEWCETTDNCNIVGCETPTNGQRRFNCDELNGVSAGDIVTVRVDGCATFYRQYIIKID